MNVAISSAATALTCTGLCVSFSTNSGINRPLATSPTFEIPSVQKKIAKSQLWRSGQLTFRHSTESGELWQTIEPACVADKEPHGSGVRAVCDGVTT
jgi:hypothetical protein